VRPNHDARPEAQPLTDSRQITTRDGIYVGLRYGVGILIGLANMFVLTWWIGPHAYGLFVAAIGLSAFLGSLTRAGADTYLIRRKDTPDTRIYNVATSLILAACSVLVLLGLAAVPALIHWYGSREFVVPYVMTLITVPLTGAAGPPIAKLERELNFRNAAGIELAGQFLAFGVSAFLAWRHFGVWAPIAGVIVSQTWVVIAAHVAAGLIPQLVWDIGEVRAMLSFGLGYTLSLRVWQLRGLVNPLLVGRLMGAEAVAFVALAVRIAESLGFLRAVAGRLAIVALSRMREDQDRFRAAIQRGLELQVLALGPLLCAFAAIAPIAVTRLFGVRWALSLQVFPWIAAAIVINSVFNLQASALYVLGEQWTVLRAYCAHIVLFAFGAYFLVSRAGLTGYGWADLVACASYWLLHRRLGEHTHLSYRRVGAGCIAFGLPLFTHLVPSFWNWILWLPLLLLAVLQLSEYTKHVKARSLSSVDDVWFFKRDARSLEASQP
jgi:O-antigen/teichoic acid export membrane protein